MKNNIIKHIKPLRPKGLPVEMREELKGARSKKGWSQRALGSRISLPQMHVSGLESGKIVPRYNTLLDYVRGLDYDLLLIPRTLVPAVLALVREHRTSEKPGSEERSLYAVNEDETQSNERQSDEV
jgi:transcriptional regulator with XRE-family HTH domain